MVIVVVVVVESMTVSFGEVEMQQAGRGSPPPDHGRHRPPAHAGGGPWRRQGEAGAPTAPTT